MPTPITVSTTFEEYAALLEKSRVVTASDNTSLELMKTIEDLKSKLLSSNKEKANLIEILAKLKELALNVTLDRSLNLSNLNIQSLSAFLKSLT